MTSLCGRCRNLYFMIMITMRMLGSCVDLRRRKSCWKRCFGRRNPFHVVCVCWDGLVLRCADRPVTWSSVRRYRCCTRFDYQPSSIDNHLWEVPPPHKQRNIYIAPTMIYICINQQALEKSFARIHKTVKQMWSKWLHSFDLTFTVPYFNGTLHLPLTSVTVPISMWYVAML